FVKYYERLSYDRQDLHQRHQRAIVSSREEDKLIPLEFHAYQRSFKFRLKRDVSVFTEDFKLVGNGRTVSAVTDVSHIYSGTLHGEEGSLCHGSIIDGHFEGFIQTQNGTYYLEPIRRLGAEESPFHSVIYRDSDIGKSPFHSDYSGFNSKGVSCGTQRLCHYLQNLTREQNPQEESLRRSQRSLDYSQTTCLLHIQADNLYYKRFGSMEVVLAQVANYIKAVNEIFGRTNFDGIRHINFKVKSVDVSQEADHSSPTYSLYIGPEKLLALHSENNWNEYCLSYLLTDRDYSGVLGLAFEGRIGNAGGICSKYQFLRDNSKATLNTGVVTLQNYGRYLPTRLVHLTLAHELGHSLGAPHDGDKECPVKTAFSHGNFLMFPRASSGEQYNNDRFSPCSIEFIARLLKAKKDQCFVESNRPICGNQILNEEEECDVGYNDTDPCCYSADQPVDRRCKLKPGKQCSPSQGGCCNHGCVFSSQERQCEEETECAFESHCSGMSAVCPTAPPKANYTLCNLGTWICLNGVCARSVCVKYGLEPCDCVTESMMEKCKLCCRHRGEPETCASTPAWRQYFGGSSILLPPGSPCVEQQGYCDKFHICRLVDADGPIARLKNSFFNFEEYKDVADWMKSYWYVLLLVMLTLAALMAGTVFLFGRNTDKTESSSEGKKSGSQRGRRARTVIYKSEDGGEDMTNICL
uniref:ADAM10 endopeptidase n=1 Tax=Latimeria chalumnae TaxID=7897 RepID=H3BF63_LATCH